jgi:hypothetical protein
MAFQFLSDEWFNEFDKIRASFGDMDIPDKLVGITINLTVTDGPEGEKHVHFKEGSFVKGHSDDAMTTLTLPFDLCKKALLGNDTKAAMKGFMTRKIKVKGDMSKMLTLASIKAEGDMEALRLKAWEMTE